LPQPDGTYNDEDRARRRGLTLGNQQADGMSELHGHITPELRATIEAASAKLAAPRCATLTLRADDQAETEYAVQTEPHSRE
jgi:hypothetical protein